MTEIENIRRGSIVTLSNNNTKFTGKVLISNKNGFEMQRTGTVEGTVYYFCRFAGNLKEQKVELFKESSDGSTYVEKYNIENHHNPFGDSDI